MNHPAWRVWLGALALVIFGVAIGVCGTTYFGMKKIRETVTNPAASRAFADRALARIQKNLAEELDLTPEQAAKVDATLAESSERMRVIRQRGLQDAREEVEVAVKKIAEGLPQEKRPAFRRHVAKRLMWLKNLPRREGNP